MRLALILPPFTQLNTPYPSISYLARHLRSIGVTASQRDLGIELALAVYSQQGLAQIFDTAEERAEQGLDLPDPAWRMLAQRSPHESRIGPVVRFLQGKDPTLASRVVNGSFLPMGPRLQAADTGRFGEMGLHDAARYLCTLFLEDIADFITVTIDTGFGFARYQSQLATGPVRLEPILDRLAQTSLIDGWLDELADRIEADAVGISIPFPGTLYGALRIGGRLKARGIRVWMGGGYVNTELREMSDGRFWRFCDALSFDDGEGPIEELLKDLSGTKADFHRIQTRETKYPDTKGEKKPFNPAPWYGELPLGDYLQLLDSLNPAHRIWSDGRWNKITLAHGCYWKKCAFCDIQLDYISRFQPAQTGELVDLMQQVSEETGISGFHFVDEAAPPKLMKQVALELLRRDASLSWWGNIRFEPTFTPDLCRLLSAAGLIMVTGGLEVASDRLLRSMHKGITVEQAARTAMAFQQAGVMVHAYLMYGFPTQTDEETLESMEIVRQLFETGSLSSAFWHRFVLTRHSGVYADPDAYGVELPSLPKGTFAANDIPHSDPLGGEHDAFDAILPQALEAWMRGERLDQGIAGWFPFKIPKPTTKRKRIRKALDGIQREQRGSDRLIWLGSEPLRSESGLAFVDRGEMFEVETCTEVTDWLYEVLDSATPHSLLTLDEARAVFPGDWGTFASDWRRIRRAGMLGI
jgi:radical SAM superfamily enzyme YgiQ (UPF0313 family)